MKKPIFKLCAFNVVFIIIAILCFSTRILGFDLGNDGAFKFALSIALSIFGVGLFLFINYNLLMEKNKEPPKLENLSTPNACIQELEKYLRTDPAFSVEIHETIAQVRTLERKGNALEALLKQNQASESFNYLKETIAQANTYVFNNVNRIITRLIVFDNIQYEQDQCYEIDSHKKYVHSVIEDNRTIITELDNLLIAISSVADSERTNLDSIRSMTEALDTVLKENPFEDSEETFTTYEEG